MKFVDVFQFFNYLLEEMSRCNCFSLQLVGGRLVGRTLELKGEVWARATPTCLLASIDGEPVGKVTSLTY